MPYQHNKKRDRKPTKRTDRPARRTATHGTKRETTRSNAPHMRGAGVNNKVHQEQHRVMPPTTHAAHPPYQMRNSKRHLPVWIAFFSNSAPLSQSHSHSAPAPPAPQANRTTKERLLPRTKLPLKAKRSRFPSRAIAHSAPTRASIALPASTQNTTKWATPPISSRTWLASSQTTMLRS